MARQTRAFGRGQARLKPTCITACYRVSALFIVLLAFCVGIALSIVLWAVIDHQQNREVDGVFQREASNVNALLGKELAQLRLFLVMLRDTYLVVGKPLTSKQLALASAPALMNSTWQRLVAYSPLVTLDQRPAFEQMLSLEENATTIITQLTPADTLEPASPRPLYLPISIILPTSNHSDRLVGFDLWSLPNFTQSTAQATATRNITSSTRIPLLNSTRTNIVPLYTSSLDPTNEQYATIFTMSISFRPQASPTSFVNILVSLPQAVCVAIDCSIDCSDPSLEVFIFDRSAPPTEQYLFQLVRSSLSLSLCVPSH